MQSGDRNMLPSRRVKKVERAQVLVQSFVIAILIAISRPKKVQASAANSTIRVDVSYSLGNLRG